MKNRMIKDLPKKERDAFFRKSYRECIAEAQAVINDPKVGQWVKNILGGEIASMKEGIKDLRAY